MISSMASISSSSSATVRVEKATSEFLIGPDWTLNMEICDIVNSNQMLGKDVVKAVKKRLQHKNPKVQLLALTLLETMVKNCGDYVHFQIAEKNILQEMVKIVKKKTDMHVRDKVLTLIGSWHEAFGGSGGRYPQYYMAYEDLRRLGVQFPRHSPDAAPIFTPPATHAVSRPPQIVYGVPSSSTTRLDEAMAAEDSLSSSSLKSMRSVLELLTDMLQAVDPRNPSSIKDEIIGDLVEQCRVNQRKLMQLLAKTGVEELLCEGLELNDSLQNALAKHDAIASGSPLPLELTPAPHAASEKQETDLQSPEVGPPAPVFPAHTGVADEEEDEEDDDFAQLARRHSKAPSNVLSSTEAPPSPSLSSAIVPVDSPASMETKDQNIIELLSIVLSTDGSTEQTDPSSPNHVPSSSPAITGNNGVAANSYVAPWAQTRPQFQPQQQYHYGARPPPQLQPQNTENAYPPPPWAATPGYFSSSQNSMTRAAYTCQTSTPTSSSNGEVPGNSIAKPAATNAGQKPFIPSYRLFEELEVFGNGDGRYTPGGNASSSLSGSNNQSMVGGRHH